MLRVIREVRPRYVVGENVRGLISWDGGVVFDEVQTDLENEGYEVWSFVLPACAVNAPHRRDRVWIVAHANECATRPSRTSGEIEGDGSGNNDEPKSGREQTEQHFGCSDVHGIDTNAKSKPSEWLQLEQREISEQKQREFRRDSSEVESKRNASYANRTGFQKARTQQQATRLKQHGELYWTEWPTQSPICSGNDGFSRELDGITFPKWRQESVKAYGNAIVPQVAHQIFKALMLAESKEGEKTVKTLNSEILNEAIF